MLMTFPSTSVFWIDPPVPGFGPLLNHCAIQFFATYRTVR